MKTVVSRMSMIFVLLFGMFSPLIISYDVHAIDEEFNRAVTWMYEKWLTKYSTPSQFGKDNFLTREQAAKFFAVFMEKSLDKHEGVSDACLFSDALLFDTTLSVHIKRACELGLFKGSNGKFMPRSALTKAEALTVLIRALEWKKIEDTSPWRSNYFWRSQMLWLTKETSVRGLDRPVTRYEMALILYRASDDYVAGEDLELSELEDLLLQLGVLDS